MRMFLGVVVQAISLLAAVLAGSGLIPGAEMICPKNETCCAVMVHLNNLTRKLYLHNRFKLWHHQSNASRFYKLTRITQCPLHTGKWLVKWKGQMVFG